MKKSQKNRRWKSLSLKIQHLQLELEDREEVLRQYEEEFLRALSSYEVDDVNPATVKPHSNDVRHQEEISREPTDNVVIDAPPPIEGTPEMKQLWRAIAVLTHPDKTFGDEEKAEFYKRANDAWRKGNYSELYKIALALDIEVPDSEVTYVTLEEITSDLEKKISEKEKSVLWEWGRAKGDAKHKILDMYLASKGKKRKA
jgi:hypothetical protein